jgi:hypothetical protein
LVDPDRQLATMRGLLAVYELLRTAHRAAPDLAGTNGTNAMLRRPKKALRNYWPWLRWLDAARKDKWPAIMLPWNMKFKRRSMRTTRNENTGREMR